MNVNDWYGLTERPEERALKSRLRRQMAVECVAGCFALATGLALMWIFLAVTP